RGLRRHDLISYYGCMMIDATTCRPVPANDAVFSSRNCPSFSRKIKSVFKGPRTKNGQEAGASWRV
ncbi:MAG: hypothetical protein CBD27_03400, partial [Rhodospirillaceae bacterium TMED167]